MCCTASALSLQTCCQAITHFHRLAFLLLLFSVGVYIFSTLQEAKAQFQNENDACLV
jgi:hypothetical protein